MSNEEGENITDPELEEDAIADEADLQGFLLKIAVGG